MKKDAYWEAALEDSLDLTAKLPVIAAYIYRMKYFGEKRKPKYNPKQDYGANFARMMKVSDKKGYADLCACISLFIVTMSLAMYRLIPRIWLAPLSRMCTLPFPPDSNALAGPLHGLANQECLAWLMDVHKQFGGVPSPRGSI